MPQAPCHPTPTATDIGECKMTQAALENTIGEYPDQVPTTAAIGTTDFGGAGLLPLTTVMIPVTA